MVRVKPLHMHVCSARCLFDSKKRCRTTGVLHVCGPECEINTSEGDCVCAWSGVVSAERAVDRSVRNNLPRTLDAVRPVARGFLMPSVRRCELGPGRSNKKRSSDIGSRQTRQLLPGNVPNTEGARYRHIAGRQVDVLFFRSGLLDSVREESIRRQMRCLRSQLRELKRSVAVGLSLGTYLDVARECAIADTQHPVCCPVNNISDATREQLRDASVDFLLAGWQRLASTKRWQQKRPDFQSYVMGVIYICREGGELVSGYPLIPRVPFFEFHTPCVADLGHLHRLLSERDGRTSLIGRRRIMEGRNAIRLACKEEMQQRSLSSFALELSPQRHKMLMTNYCAANADPVNGVLVAPR
jgi:hypothetical protein